VSFDLRLFSDLDGGLTGEKRSGDDRDGDGQGLRERSLSLSHPGPMYSLEIARPVNVTVKD